MEYDHQTVEKKWQKVWEDAQVFAAKDNSKKENFYLLVEFPYPSGNLHVGHWYAFCVPDILARTKHMQGFNVLYPIGFDAFGLPAENAAIKHGLNPRDWTYKNMDHMRSQIASMGTSFDFSREIVTCDPQYYKWTQWFFLQFFKNKLATQGDTQVNWCPSCKTVLANEQVVSGHCERCDAEVSQKEMKQWNLKITKYADRLIDDLEVPNVILIHGLKGGGSIGWFGSLQKYLVSKNIECTALDFPNPKKPIYDEWESFFDEHLKSKINSNTVILGHSLGCGFLQRYLSKNSLYVSELIFVAPTVGDCDMVDVDNFFYKKEKRGQKCHSKGDAVGPSQFSSIVWDELAEVKKKKNKKLQFSQIKKVVETDGRKIVFDGETIIYHFNHKSSQERRARMFWGRTIIAALDKLYFESDKVGYFLSKNRVIRVVLSRVDAENFVVKTFYESQRLSKAYHSWKNSSKSTFFDYKKIKDSAAKISIFGGGKDVCIKKDAFDYLAHKLGAEFYFFEQEGHWGQSKIENNSFILDYFKKIEKKFLHWPKEIKTAQKNWIGRSYGINIYYEIIGRSEKISVFTTTPVNFGMTFLVLAPEHKIVQTITTAEQKNEVDAYIKWCAKRTDIERMAEGKEKTGVFTGAYALNHLTGEQVPIWVADFALAHVGTGAVQGCPAHDERDFEFAKKFKLPIVRVVENQDRKTDKFIDPETETVEIVKANKGITRPMVNSEFINGVPFDEAMQKTMDYFEEKGWGKRVSNYKLRDWTVSRQRYWGVPIPIIHCEKCGPVAVPDKELPVELPEVEDYLPREDGRSPLAKATSWLKTECPKCSGPAERETDTFDTFLCSSWYFLRYADPQNGTAFADRKKLDYWQPVDLYSGGNEHTTMHVLYSRFWHKALFDLGLVPTKEPYTHRMNRGLIMGPDGQKMSKSKGNVIDPDTVVSSMGSDTVRMYLAFIGPYNQMGSYPWNPDGIRGVKRFLDRVIRLSGKVSAEVKAHPDTQKILHKAIQKIAEQNENLKFNSSVADLMIVAKALEGLEHIDVQIFEEFLKILGPFAPHLSEELWEKLGHKNSIFLESWPVFNAAYLVEDSVTYAVQINGKVRADFEIFKDASKEEVLKKAKGIENVQKYLGNQTVKKEIFVPGKIVGFVV